MVTSEDRNPNLLLKFLEEKEEEKNRKLVFGFQGDKESTISSFVCNDICISFGPYFGFLILLYQIFNRIPVRK